MAFAPFPWKTQGCRRLPVQRDAGADDRSLVEAAGVSAVAQAEGLLLQLALPGRVVGVCSIRANVVTHAKYVTFQWAEVAVPRQLFGAILERIRRLRLACASR